MEITQRNATYGDAQALLLWRNHPDVRAFSLQSELIPINEHTRWLADRLLRVDHEPFYIFESEFEVIGMCRLDLLPGAIDEYEISILVDPNRHAKGIGTKILKMSCTSFFCSHPNKSIVAKVRKDNLVSRKLFESADFDLQITLGDLLYFKKDLN
jgi:RimJ/RimL family protein N-acetyltransferase